ncbi:hypothetical protein D9757_007666 [Collybiopsis confluens]|uniref:Nucleolar protein 14 n=1 Tax=Collybiopsis confluens TaxID=2823264 RepID=A0A8H5H9R4_9AGAR|nr:hypothetical protein D9757_007666 [Collybiopsis confluens]
MVKGSQLSQLKSALSHAGITGNQQNNGKKRKRGQSQDKDKEKQASKLEDIQRKLNPFDVKVTKLKHDVGGRKLKGVTGKPAQSKMAGLEQRKKTLLKEYEEKHRAGGIIDRRFGENDPSMSLEERMLERFTRERQRASKGVAFNLEDEDELTHYGQSLSRLDDFDDIGLRADDDEEDDGSGQINKNIVKHAHFGGFEEEDEDDDEGVLNSSTFSDRQILTSSKPARKKSKAEVMAEVIAKSKDHKLRRQMEKEDGENVRHELDQDFDALRNLIYAPDPSATGSNSTPLVETEKTVNYDQVVRELVFDQRAKPKDRTKTEEELASEEKDALERAERRRRKRMLGLDDSDSEDEGKPRAKRRRGGDDLEDDFDDEEIGYGLGTGLEGNDGDEGESEDDEEEEGDDDDEAEESDVSLEDADGGNAEELVVSFSKSGASSRKVKSKDLPFTFPCPSSHEEFIGIVENVDEQDIPTVVQRIRALHHTSLAPDNKFKLQRFTGVLIDYILSSSSPPSLSFTVVNSLFPHLVALTQAYPIQAAEHFNQKLVLMNKNLKRGLTQGALNPESKTWPGPAELTLFRVIGYLWPTSDMNHAVVSPTRILLGSYLGLARVRSLRDIGSGLFLSTLFLQYEQLSHRFVPEAVNFLVNSVLHLAPSKYENASDLPGSFPSPDFRSALCRPLMLDAKGAKGLQIQKPDLGQLLTADDKNDASAKLNLLALSLDLLGRYANQLKGLEAFIEVFESISEILRNLKLQKFEPDLQARARSTREIIERLLKFSRQSRRPLLLQAHKAIPIPSYVPKFDSTSSSYLKRQDPDRERNEAAKLRNEYKQERKGAIRELRKDAKFLAGVEQAKQKEKDKGYNERMKRVFGSIEGERAEQKAMDRDKTKEKKRAGRK